MHIFNMIWGLRPRFIAVARDSVSNYATSPIYHVNVIQRVEVKFDLRERDCFHTVEERNR